ncbi:hypothetical protein UVI_02033720 [Ustilaginoidea virens]|nr:hypothetical protein UVI_02033720 [Ustilaginoidea virens]
MPSRLAVVALLPLTQLAICQPTASFPFNAQLPLAARINEFFSYSFSPYTFRSDSNITYSLGDHPGWLSIDSGGRRLYGTPKEGDVSPGQVVGQIAEIIATDRTGATSMNATLVVSRQPAPQVVIPIEKQMAHFGNFSAPSSILSYPSADFKYSFDPKTFGETSLNYYAVSGNGSPLPAWAKFDPASLTLSGRTPPVESLIQPPQTFDFSLVASDIVGFSACSLMFSIVVGSHKLTTFQPILMVNASRGSEVNYDGLQNAIKLDGKPVSAGDLTVVVKDMPTWLSFDDKTWKLRGTPNNSSHANNFTITFKDSFSDNLDVLVLVSVATNIFGTTLGDLVIRPGSEFDLDLSQYLKDPSDVTVKVSTNPSEDWLKVDGLKLSGPIPKTSRGGFQLSIDASSRSFNLEEKEVVNVTFLAPDGATSTFTQSSSSSTSTSTATRTDGPAPDNARNQSSRLSTGKILAATIIPTIFVAILLAILIRYCRRRRARNTYLGSKFRSKISSPIPVIPPANGPDQPVPEGARIHDGAVVHTEMILTKPAKSALADGHSPMSSRRPSSETFGHFSSSEIAQSVMVDATRTTTSHNTSGVSSEDGRQSWITIEGHDSTERSDSNHSDFTRSKSTRQVFPGADLATHRGEPALDMLLPTLNEFPFVQPTPPLFHSKSHQSPPSCNSAGDCSTATSSSMVLPHLADADHANTPALSKWTTGSTARGDASSESNWITLNENESGENLPELQRPSPLVLSNSRPVGSSGGKSAVTDVSFTSSENWRIIGRLSPTKAERSHKDVEDESLLHALRRGTARDGAKPGEREDTRLELNMPDQLGNETHSSATSGLLDPSVTTASKLSGMSDLDSHMSGRRGDEAGGDWLREHSAKMSEGSFKVFL